MTIALPNWNGRISPVFDVAETILIVQLGPEGERSERSLACPVQSPDRRAGFLATAGAETLICGAISRPLEMAVASLGIDVIPHICGDIDDVLEAFGKGALDDARYRMPGCCGRQRRRRCGRRGQRNF
ncbi:MAG: NifB/NifX family molybdenum-iron cluster-binding protein [Verrucomicrobiota bacterium]